MKTKVTLSEQELRRLIRATLLEVDDDTAALDSIPFDEPLDPSKIGATGEIDYLLKAFNQFSPDDIVISAAENLPTAEKTPKAIKAFLEAKESSYGFTTPAWPGSGTIDEQRQRAFEYVTLLLKCKIIDLLNDKNNTVNPRYVFFIDDAVYRRDQINPADQATIEKLSGELGITSPAIQFNTPTFFEKLGDKAFVETISDPNSGAAVAGPLKEEFPTSFYISKALAETFNKKAQAAAAAAVVKIEALLNQFDTDFVENFFCTPLVFPDVWKKYCFDISHPLSTPWRQSYVIMNIASQAASVAGGAAALYSKLMSYYTQGASVQMGEKVGQQDPFAPTNMFRSLQESKKILVTLDELKRVISAALQLEADKRSVGAWEWLGKAGEGIAGIFKRSDVKGAENAAVSLARAGIKATGRYAAELQAALSEFPNLGIELQSIPFEPDVLRVALDTVIQPAGAGPEAARVKDVVIDTLVNVASKRAEGEKLDKIMLDLIGGGGAAFTGDLSKIQNWSRPLRDYAARMLTDSARNEILTGQGAADSIAKALSSQASDVADALRDSLISNASKFAPAIDGKSELLFDLQRRVFTKGGKEFANLNNVDLNKVRKLYGDAGVKLVEDAQKYNKQIDALNNNKIVVGSTQVDIADLLAKSQIDATLTGANDALRSAMISPAIASKTAKLGEFLGASEEVTVGIEQLDKYRRKGTGTTWGLYRGLGKFGRGFKKSNPVANIIFGANKILLGEPVRLIATGVRAVAGDTSLIGRLSDTIATSGVYQQLIGLWAFNYIVNTAAGTTPGTREEGGLLNVLDMILPDGPVSLGIGNFMLAGIADVVDSRINQSGNTQIANFLETNPFTAYEALGDAIKAYYNAVDVKPLSFPDLTVSTISGGYRTAYTRALQNTGEALGLLSAVSAGDGEVANQVVAQLNAAGASLTPLITVGSGGASTEGNTTWKLLEGAREGATTDLIQQLSESSKASTGGSTSGVAGYSSILTKYYPPTKETAIFDPVSETLFALASRTLGVEASANDFAEFFGYFSGNDRALATLGLTPKGTVTEDQITAINAKLKELGAQFDKLKADREKALGGAGASSAAPAAPAPDAPAP